MLDLTWKIFSRTGNIETYLLLKELEKEEVPTGSLEMNNDQISPLNPEL